jgi:hypothetical protein
LRKLTERALAAIEALHVQEAALFVRTTDDASAEVRTGLGRRDRRTDELRTIVWRTTDRGSAAGSGLPADSREATCTNDGASERRGTAD